MRPKFNYLSSWRAICGRKFWLHITILIVEHDSKARWLDQKMERETWRFVFFQQDDDTKQWHALDQSIWFMFWNDTIKT